MTPTINAEHARTVAAFLKTPCALEVTSWPYDCEAQRKYPDHVVTTCRTHHAWWHAAR